MKLGIIGSTLGLLSILTITQAAKADDGHGRHKIRGLETFNAHIVLTATDSAPDARGQLNLQSVNQNGAGGTQMEIQTFGLDAGDYTVAATFKSGADPVSIGTISAGNPHLHGHGNGNGQGNDNGQGNENGKGKGRFRTANHFRLPDSVSPTDISQITVSDSNGTTDLIGDFVNLGKGSFVLLKANVAVDGGEAAPHARGNASVNVVAVNTNVTATVTVAASNLPTNTVLNVTANDQPVGTVTTGKNGGAILRNLRNVSVQGTNDVTLSTTSGSTAATAGF